MVYPPEHGPLLEAVSAAGAAVSEFAPGVPPLAFHFPRRNRIISGLCLAVVVSGGVGAERFADYCQMRRRAG